MSRNTETEKTGKRALKMAVEKEREYRALQDFALVPQEGEADAYRVRGTATVFDTPACLYEIDGVKYYEVIDRKAFDECDLSDVIMNYNHSGKVVARVRNKTMYTLCIYGGIIWTTIFSATATAPSCLRWTRRTHSTRA